MAMPDSQRYPVEKRNNKKSEKKPDMVKFELDVNANTFKPDYSQLWVVY